MTGDRCSRSAARDPLRSKPAGTPLATSIASLYNAALFDAGQWDYPLGVLRHGISRSMSWPLTLVEEEFGKQQLT